jgi:hypothetical protein
MPSSNNLIQSLRSAHDPHFKLEGKVGGLEKGLGIEVAKLHKTLSKSFAMQRKTLARVLGLEGRVGVLESQQAAEEQAQEGIDEILDEILGDSGDKPKKKKPAAKKKKRPATPVGKKIPKKKPVAKKKKISAKDLKKGSSQETIGERIDRLEQNAQDSAEGDERRKTSVYQEDVYGVTSTGEQISGAERKRRFKLRKKGIKVDDIKKGTSVQGAENVAPNNEVTDLAKRQAAGDLPQGVTEPPAQGEDQQSPMLEGVKGPLKAIAESIDRIKDSLTGQSKVQEDAIEDARKSDEEKDAKKAESGLEKFLGPVKAAGEKIIAPVKSLFGQIWDFFKTIFLGRIAFKLFEWFSNPANTDKVKSIFNFLADWWPVLVAGLMAIVGPGITFAVGLVALLAWGIPKIINAVKSVFGFGKDIDKEIKTGEAGLKKDMENVGGDAKDSLEKESGMPGNETPAEVSNLQKSNQDVQNQNVPKFNKGGEVPGSGDKDTVPAMLTPGEFVMSKGAVEQYGIDTMEGMNAAAGGTNIPTVQKGGGKGMNMMIPRFSGGGKAAGVVTDPKERQQQEAYMLKYVNEERALQGLEPLTNLTYAPGVELTKMIGPGPRTKETSDTITDLDRGIETTSTSKTVDGKTTFGASIRKTTEEDRQKFFAENPHAAQLVNLKDQIELDNLGADISASAKMNGGGLVPAFAGGGIVGRLKNAGANVLGKAKAQISKLQKPRVDHIHPPADPVSNAGASQVAQSSSDAATASTEPAPGIPNFDAGMMRSQSKIRTLGVSV